MEWMLPSSSIPYSHRETKHMAKETKKEEAVKEEVKTETKSKKTSYTVQDPQVVRPKELPLILTPDGGEWSNEEQAEYAGYLNAYAYRNPEKWEIKKASLLRRLEEIGSNPSAIINYRGNEARISYKNKLMEN